MATLQANIDAVATVAGINLGGFQTFTGGEESAEVADDFVPGAVYADKNVGNASLSNIIIKRSWNEARDRPLYNQLKGKMRAPSTIGKLTRDENKNVTDSEPFIGKLIRSKGTEGDTNGGTNRAEWELEFAVTGRG